MTKTTPEIISGRKDWDVVSFSDYSSDMKENGERVKILHETYQHEIKNLKRTIWWLVLAAGGKITVSRDQTWHDLRDIDWRIEKNDYNYTQVFEAKVTSKS